MRRLLLASVLLAACSSATQPTPPGRLVDVGGGRRLHLDCRGSGSPTVVFESGAGEGWYSWYPIHDRLAREFRACSYDRAGFGFSDPRPDRSFAAITEDLHELLKRSGEKGPFVLVGHSMGGEIVRDYAARHPDDVAGLVLVDSSSESGSSSPELREAGRKHREKRSREIEEWRKSGKWPEMWAPDVLPKNLQKTVLQLSASQKWWEARFAEGNLPDAKTHLPPEKRALNVPLIVITGSKWNKPAGWTDDALQRLMKERIDRGAELASRSPRSEHLVVEAGHHVHHEKPEVVIEAIRNVARRSQE